MRSRRKAIKAAVVEALESRRLLTVTPGILDTSFNSTGIVTDTNLPAVAHEGIQSDGKILVIGTPSPSIGGVSRYNTDGSLDTTFGSNGSRFFSMGLGNGFARDLVVMPDDSFYVTGSFESEVVIIGFNADGSFNSNFHGGGYDLTSINGEGEFISTQSDGSFIVGCSDLNGGIFLTRFDSSGNQDTTFGSGGTVTPIGSSLNITDLFVQSNDKIDFSFNDSIGLPAGYVRQLTANGGTDVNFGANGGTLINSVTVNGAHVIAAGNDASGNGIIDEFDVTGSPVSGFGSSGQVTYTPPASNTVQFLRVTTDANNEILVTGEQSDGVTQQMLVGRFDPTGNIDTTFGTNGIALGAANGDTQANDIELEPTTGSIVISGGSPTANHEEIQRYLGGAVPSSSIAPVASMATLGTVRRRSATFTFAVNYQSPVGQLIDTTSLSLNNISISGSHGGLFHPTGMIVGRQRTGGYLTVVYTVNLPTGQFVNNRSYGIILGANQVKDQDGTFAALDLLQRFNVLFSA